MRDHRGKTEFRFDERLKLGPHRRPPGSRTVLTPRRSGEKTL